MNSRASLLAIIGLLALVALLAAFMLKPDFFIPSATAGGDNETTHSLLRDLSNRVDVLEREIAAMKNAGVNGSESSGSQADVAKVLGEMSDRWMRNMSGSLEDIKGELYAIRKILEQ